MVLNHPFLPTTEAARVLLATTKLSLLPSEPVAISGLFIGTGTFHNLRFYCVPVKYSVLISFYIQKEER